MPNFTLELYYEQDGDRALAETERTRLIAMVKRLAPHIELTVCTKKAVRIMRAKISDERDVPYHPPSRAGVQSLLITREEIGALGWGWPDSCCVNMNGIQSMNAKGGDSANITMHEWLHTIVNKTINGGQIPFADDATDYGFTSDIAPDGSKTWHEFYRFALSGVGGTPKVPS